MTVMTFRPESASRCVCYVNPARIHGHMVGFDAFDRPYSAVVDDFGAICFVEFNGAALFYQQS